MAAGDDSGDTGAQGPDDCGKYDLECWDEKDKDQRKEDGEQKAGQEANCGMERMWSWVGMGSGPNGGVPSYCKGGDVDSTV